MVTFKTSTVALWSSPKLAICTEIRISGMATTRFFAYQTHDLIVVIEIETFSRQRQRAKQTSQEERRQKDKEKREEAHQLSLCQMTSFVAPLSFLSHLLGWTESSFSLSCSLGWLLHWSPLRHLFSCPSLLLFSVGCYFPETLWISHKPFLHPPSSPLLLLSHLTAWTHIQHLPHKPTVHLCPSACLLLLYCPPIYIYLTFLNSMQSNKHPWDHSLSNVFSILFSLWPFLYTVHTCK